MAGERSNQEWLEALSADPPADAAVHDLRELIARRLGASFAGRGVDRESLEDFTQEATLRVLDRLASFRGDSRFATWVHSIAVRVAFTQLRRRKIDTQPVDELVAAAGARPANQDLPAESAELEAALRAAIDTALTERQRTMILGELSGISTEVLAEHLGTNRNALYKLYYDARKRLREALTAAGISREDVRRHLDRASQ